MKQIQQEIFNKKLNTSINKYLSLSDKQSLSIGIYHKGDMYYYNNDGKLEYKYDMGSISKTIISHLILDLYYKGKLDLNDRVDKYLDLKKGNYPTILELLTHRAGYNHVTPIEIIFPRLLTGRYSKKNLYRNCTKETVLKCLERRRHRKIKTHKYNYSDFSTAILSIVIESILGVSFKDALEDFVFNKLDLKETKLTSFDRSPKAILGKKEIPFWEWKSDNPYISSGGLITNIEDMLKYIKLQIESNEDYIVNAHTPQEYKKTKKETLGICIGWHTYEKSNQLWHVGGVGTFRSSIIVNKVKKIGVIVLGNTIGVRSANVHYLAKVVYGNLKHNKIKFEKD